VGRLLLDFLRATDVPYADARYFGLTPAQYAAFALVAYGVWRLMAPERSGRGREWKPPREHVLPRASGGRIR
jgi:phosphatidylglycerol:prolipoprotein diacylglycerol transferase